MTVREALLFAAQLLLPKGMPAAEKAARALAVAMSANPKFAEADPKLKVALSTLHSRVAQLADGGRPMTLQQR